MKYSAEIRTNEIKHADEVTHLNMSECAAPFVVIKEAFGEAIDHEDNETEARIVCSNLNNYHGGGYIILRNLPSVVERAKDLGSSRLAAAGRSRWLEEAYKLSVPRRRRRLI